MNKPLLTHPADLRTRCVIHSATAGSIMMVPREDKLVRIYCQLNEIKPDQDGRLDRSKVTPSVILKAAQKILHPCKHFRSSDIPSPTIVRVRAMYKKPVSFETRFTVRSTPERTMLTFKPINRQAGIQALRLVDCIPGKWNHCQPYCK